MDIGTSSGSKVDQVSSLLGDALRKDENPSAEIQDDPKKEILDQDPQEIEGQEVESQSSDESLSEESDESQDGIESFNDLAEELDVPIEDMYALSFNMPKSEAFPDGGKVSLGELKDFYTENINIEQERSALKEKEQQLLAQSEQVSEVPKISNELLQARAQVLAIQDAYNRTDWQGLRHSNQAEYAALQQDFRTQFETAKHQEMLAGQQMEQHEQETMRIQQERLIEVMPDLKNDEFRENAAKRVTSYVAKYGITAKELEMVTDHRIMRMLIEASSSDTAKITAKSKKLEKKAPKTTRPISGKSIPGRNAALKRLTEKARTGTKDDKVNAIRSLITG